ncbi:sugar ABC transporter ATP-binding protein [Pelobium manganitolerans]|uniref:sugar ABC transporter ATP-binding protein n=1 Tax=Pelobium manganitolerans TaxID=1842495 RepID=UPI003FA3A96C
MLEARKVSKNFSGVKALDNVDLQLHFGKVTAIIGENGAGKSTLMKILSGVYPDYEGQLFLNGEEVRFKNTKEAQQAGISIIHQELNLIPYLSVTENLYLGRELFTAWGTLDQKLMRQGTIALLQKLKLNVRPDQLVAELKVGQQQVVEIAKALLCDAQIIIMDEPTSAISESEVAILHSIIAELKAEQKAIVYISHKLKELFQIADRYTVLRDGQTVESGEMTGINYDSLVSKMVGRALESNCRSANTHADTILMDVRALATASLFKDISFYLRKGEVLGIFGLMGAGRTELMEALMGQQKDVKGQVFLEGCPLKLNSATAIINAGLALVPEDRKSEGLVLGLDVQSNISLSCLAELEDELKMINSKEEQSLAKNYISSLKIKTSSAKQLVQYLSGGNQQKVVIAKCMATKPKVLMLDEPTRGIDINAKTEIYKLIDRLACEGLGVIMVSSELPEIFAITDRVLVMADGRITAVFNTAEVTEDIILKAAIAEEQI